jgi:hypothetical protein
MTVCIGGVDLDPTQPLGVPHEGEREKSGGSWERRREMVSTHEISEFLFYFSVHMGYLYIGGCRGHSSSN